LKNRHTTFLRVTLPLLFFTGLALLLRFLYLGNTFDSSDSAALPAKVLYNHGYLWMMRGKYGILISLYVKLVVGTLSAVGVTITEFWWKAPVATVGTLQVPLTYFFLARLGCKTKAALSGAALIAILPIHVMQSRYVWGYEVLGVFFVTLAFWALLNLFRRPSRRTGLVASLTCGLYLISHGYIIPFVPCLFAAAILLVRSRDSAIGRRLGTGIVIMGRSLVWVFPLLFLPLYYHPLEHTLGKDTRLGFYLADHVRGFVGNVGIPLGLLMVAAAVLGVTLRRMRSRESILFAICGASYLAPLFFGAPPGITVVRGYMLVGTCFWLVSLAAAFDRLMERKRAVGVLVICFCMTLWGTVASIFGRDRWFDPALVTAERGAISADPGCKAAGYLVRRYVPRYGRVLAIHGAMELPNYYYYVGRLEHAFSDLSFRESINKFLALKDEVDVVICDWPQALAVQEEGTFVRRAVLCSENAPRMWIYTRPLVPIPHMTVDVGALNRAFDREYSWRVSLW